MESQKRSQSQEPNPLQQLRGVKKMGKDSEVTQKLFGNIKQ